VVLTIVRRATTGAALLAASVAMIVYVILFY
jgi:hypothetical protein